MANAAAMFALAAGDPAADWPAQVDGMGAAAGGNPRAAPGGAALGDARPVRVGLRSAGIGWVLAQVRLGEGRVVDARFGTVERAYLDRGPDLGFWEDEAAAAEVAAIECAVEAFDLVSYHWPSPRVPLRQASSPGLCLPSGDRCELTGDRSRGRPWPEDGWRSAVWGEDGWCRACGTPQGPQTGALTLEGRGMDATGGWWPVSWRDGVCLSGALADAAAEAFGVETREVAWHGESPGAAAQLVIPVSDRPWFDPAELDAAGLAAHGVPGVVCPACGVKRWRPLMFNPPPGVAGQLPPMRVEPGAPWPPIMASPEWFGDGLNSYRQVLVRPDFGEFLNTASPRDFRIRSIGPDGHLM
jgi:hypothetical protein